MKDTLIAKLEDSYVKSHIREYQFIDERDVMFHVLTGRTHLYVKFYEKTPVGVVVQLTDYFKTTCKLKVVDIQHPLYTVLRVEVSQVSETWARD